MRPGGSPGRTPSALFPPSDSKHRFVTAPFEATVAGGAWLTHAAHANAMAARLAKGLAVLGYTLPYRTEANAVFVRLSPAADAHLRSRGHGYYPFGPDGLVRLMCSFDTEPEDVDGFLGDASGVAANSRR